MGPMECATKCKNGFCGFNGNATTRLFWQRDFPAFPTTSGEPLTLRNLPLRTFMVLHLARRPPGGAPAHTHTRPYTHTWATSWIDTEQRKMKSFYKRYEMKWRVCRALKIEELNISNWIIIKALNYAKVFILYFPCKYKRKILIING